MVKIELVSNLKETERGMNCIACGKFVKDDPKAVRMHLGFGNVIVDERYLCDDCRKELIEKLSNCNE